MAGASRQDPLLVIGGAPCQPFSKASYWTDPGDEARYRRARARGQRARRPTTQPKARPDSRRSLVKEFWRIVEECRADAFLFENVPSILHPRNQRELKSLLTRGPCGRLQDCRSTRQRRRFWCATAQGSRLCACSAKGHCSTSDSDALRMEATRKGILLPAATAGEALAPFSGPAYFEPEEVVTGRWAEHLRTVPPGWNYKAHTAWGGHPRPTFETETRFWHFLLKLHPDQPSWTIAANPGPWTGPFHWDSRRLRTPELAALQAFPLGYEFAGTRRDRVRQIGNAVPPPLARRMVEPLIVALRAAQLARGR